MPPPTPNLPEPFELGLCMAGAISAGAYTAGVVDFITQALDEWERLRGDPEVPAHRVVLKGMSGASAGSLTAALFAATASHEIPPVPINKPRHGAPTANRLYEAWVDRIDIEDLLTTDDEAYCWPPGSSTPVALRSILDSTLLDTLAAEVFRPAPQATAVARPWLDPAFHLFVSLANLRGVPYTVNFRGNHPSGHIMSLHMDYAPFVRSATAPVGSLAVPLDPAHPGTGYWPALAQAALSSGAFPLFLAPRKITTGNAPGFYGAMPWCAGIVPSWPPGVAATIQATPGQPYDFWTVDGGTLNNEPIDLIRRHLYGRTLPAAVVPAPAAHRLLLLIDPFVGFDPNAYANNTAQHPSPLDLLGSVFSAAKMQSRFKPGELIQAVQEADFSRYLIAPVRTKVVLPNQQLRVTDVTAIACGVLGGFGGFLDHEFRRHDYHLGRRNAQQFLRRHFALVIDPFNESLHNPRFASSDTDAIQRGNAWRKAHGQPADSWSPWHFTEKDEDGVTRHYRPIVPLLGTADAPVTGVSWPRYTEDQLDVLAEQIAIRFDYVSGKMTAAIGGFSWWAGAFARIGLWFGHGAAVDAIKAKIREQLTAHDYLLP